MNPLAIFTGPYALLAKWGVIAIVVVAFGGFCWLKGNEHGTQKLNDYKAAEAIKDVEIKAAREKVVTVTETKWRTKIEKVLVEGNAIEREVKDHVTKDDDAVCAVALGFVREWNAGWQGVPPGPAEDSDRRPSGVPLSEVAAATVHNATSCLTFKAQRDGLIDYLRSLQKAN